MVTELCVGFAFTFTNEHEGNHLHFIASSVNEPEVVLLNFTTKRKRSDHSCVVQAGEHPAITHESVVAYERGSVEELSKLEDLLAQNEILIKDPLTHLMDRVWEGAYITRNLPFKCKQILVDQGLI